MRAHVVWYLRTVVQAQNLLEPEWRDMAHLIITVGVDIRRFHKEPATSPITSHLLCAELPTAIRSRRQGSSRTIRLNRIWRN